MRINENRLKQKENPIHCKKGVKNAEDKKTLKKEKWNTRMRVDKKEKRYRIKPHNQRDEEKRKSRKSEKNFKKSLLFAARSAILLKLSV